MQSIRIIADGDKVTVSIDGVTFTDLRCFSISYIAGTPLRFTCDMDIGKPSERVNILS